MTKLEVDISRIEIENNLPHWLSPLQRYDFSKIRAKHRARYLAEREAARKERQCQK
jgi:hypothetical protein